MLIKDLPFHSSFSSIVKPLVSEEKDKLLAIASLQELKNFIPEIDTATNIDLLPIAFNACVINRPNKNGDMIDADTALATYKHFVNKFIDTEHNRQKVIGVILTASLSEFGTDRLLSESEVIGSSEPFNITLGGILWKAVNSDLCDLVEESNDPTSTNYLSVSASWELGFSGYKIVEMSQGEKDFSTARILTSPEEIEGVTKYLKAIGGSGVKDGKCYYRMPNKDVIPMGIGLTEKPAAEVKGVAIKEEKNDETKQNQPEKLPEQVQKAFEENQNQETISESKEIFSQDTKINVKLEREYNMKITSIADITDENLKQCSASAIAEFVSSELKKASESFSKEQAQKEDMHKKLQEQHDNLNNTVAQMKATMDALSKEKQDREAVDTFNARMNDTCAKYDFPHDVAKVVADDLKSCADEAAYANWQAKADTLFRPYLKKAKAEDMEASAAKKDEAKEEKTEKVDSKQEEKEEAKASEVVQEPAKEQTKEETKEAIASVVEEALDNAKEETASLPNSSSATAPGLKEKFKQAFAEENFVIKL